MALIFVLPVIAKREFGATNWQTFLVTAPPLVLMTLGVFWNALYAARPLPKYLLTFWLVASLPLLGVALAPGYWWMLLPHIIASAGGAGWHPVAGDLVKRLYPDHRRGRIYSLLFGIGQVGSAGAGLGMGRWLTADPDAFRVFLPIIAAVQGVGCVLLWFLARRAPGGIPTPAPSASLGIRRTLLDPILHMRSVLREDPVFARYEGAYMTYGVGWMIGFALLPIFATDALDLPYDVYTGSTTVPYQLALVAMIVPAGLLLDRIGAVRSTGLSFALLTLYPLGLMVSDSPWMLAMVSVFYGIAHAGASVGWMLGPVALAPTPAKAPQYVAIHATLVGVRGALFQFLGVALYQWTGLFSAAFGVAAAAYLWSAWQMFRLHAVMRDRR